jgi:PEGA domain
MEQPCLIAVELWRSNCFTGGRPACCREGFVTHTLICLLWLASAPTAVQPVPFGWYERDSAARIEVKPKQTEVYVDGYLVGTADDFDSFTQRLRLPSGEHQIELYLEGHRSIREKVVFQPGETYRFRHTMESLAAGEAAPARPQPDPNAPATAPRGPRHDPFGAPMPPRAAEDQAGSLSIRVQPSDAVVLIDGERWHNSDPGARLVVHVTEGTHRVEVRKEGYKPFVTTIDVRRGEVNTLNVSLSQ